MPHAGSRRAVGGRVRSTFGRRLLCHRHMTYQFDRGAWCECLLSIRPWPVTPSMLHRGSQLAHFADFPEHGIGLSSRLYTRSSCRSCDLRPTCVHRGAVMRLVLLSSLAVTGYQMQPPSFHSLTHSHPRSHSYASVASMLIARSFPAYSLRHARTRTRRLQLLATLVTQKPITSLRPVQMGARDASRSANLIRKP